MTNLRGEADKPDKREPARDIAVHKQGRCFNTGTRGELPVSTDCTRAVIGRLRSCTIKNLSPSPEQLPASPVREAGGAIQWHRAVEKDREEGALFVGSPLAWHKGEHPALVFDQFAGDPGLERIAGSRQIGRKRCQGASGLNVIAVFGAKIGVPNRLLYRSLRRHYSAARVSRSSNFTKSLLQRRIPAAARPCFRNACKSLHGSGRRRASLPTRRRP